ncbi:hypothetical protein BU23DRAFT_572194 [Bimuria novae-zelandiae CBS 107.79]|uniref:Uncharacterized protein n=1 Tax=Bimuria novae-zelandiae CBS 107.79 TaxID=1447943 RepID=A0A6A5UVZ5_9PLEO|nr:hypothetical protein BU23DRAFT_572194 [Bimuria novae-zelandiae CBS 107.79]
MFFLSKTGLLALCFSQLGAAADTYFMDPKCFERSPANADGFREAMCEVIYHVGMFANALYLGDQRYYDILRWSFGIDNIDPDMFNVVNCYRRVSELTMESLSLENTLVRIYCGRLSHELTHVRH